MALRTEYPFRLPKGYVDADGVVHQEGTMRLATARDELEPLGDPKVRDVDDPYLAVIVLSRVVTRLGTLTRLGPRDMEGLFAADLAYLQDVYATINYGSEADIRRFLAARPADAASPANVDGEAGPQPAAGPPTRTPISDAARSAVSAVPSPDGDDLDPDEPSARPTAAPRRSRIEEVGRSSGRPG